MRAIIIDDKDARALLDSLELEKMRLPLRGAQIPVEEIHRAFHYKVCCWLQDQGANVVR